MKQNISKSSNTLLDNLGLHLNTKVERELQIDNKFYDGYVPELKLLIEVDGIRFHSSPEQKLNDLYKENLAKENDFNFIRITCDNLKEVPTILPQLIEKVNKFIPS